MNIIEMYTKLLSDKLGEQVLFDYYIDFNGIHSPEYRILTINDLDRSKSEEGIRIRLNFKERTDSSRYISRFRLVQIPGCCGICVSTGVYVEEEFRNKKINSTLNNMRVEIAKYCGYGLLLCTDIDTNTYERKVLKKNEWIDIFQFRNPRTQNLINITVKEL